MSERIRVLGIAPYENMKNQMSSLAKDYPQLELSVFVGDRETGLEIARQNFHGNYDVVISRGGTASMLRENLALPVVEIDISTYDLLCSLRLAGGLTSRVAMVCTENIASNARRLRELMDLDIEIYPYDTGISPEAALSQATRDENRALLCDMVAYTTATTHGYNAFLITSSTRNIRRAFDQAVLLCSSQTRLRDENLFLRELLRRQIGYTVILDQMGDLYLSTMDTTDPEVLEMFRREVPESIRTPERRITRNLNGMLYVIRTSQISLGNITYIAFFFDVRKAPIGFSHMGIQFFARPEVEARYCDSVFSIAGILKDEQTEIEHILRTNMPVMIAGEDGTGKESAVDLIYLQSSLQNNPLITINCSILGEKEWNFLYEHHNSPLADAGCTLYFTNTDALTMERCRQLISVLTEMQVCNRNRVFFSSISPAWENISPIGSEIVNKMRCFTLFLPPMRELSERIPEMMNLLLSRLNVDVPVQILGMDSEAVKLMQNYHWPHNYSQFRRILSTLMLTASGQIITASEVKTALQKERHLGTFAANAENNAIPVDLNRPLDVINRDIARRVVDEMDGNRTASAKRLGISRSTLWRLLQQE